MPYSFLKIRASRSHYSMLAWLRLGALVLILSGCTGLSAPSPTPILVPTPALTTVPTLAPATLAPSAPSPSPLPPTQAPLTPTPAGGPTLIWPKDPERALLGFGPASPSGQWFVARYAESFALVPLGRTLTLTEPVTRRGEPLGWSNDGLLLLWVDPASPTVLRATEGIAGSATTVFSSTWGPVRGATWLRDTLLYATEAEGRVRLLAFDAQTVLAQLAERQFAGPGLLPSGDEDLIAFMTTNPLSATDELHLFQRSSGALRTIDSGPSNPANTFAWDSADGLVYNLGAGLRRYDPLFNAIAAVELDADPLTATPDGMLLMARTDQALYRWRADNTIEPLLTGGAPVRAADALYLRGGGVLFLINGEVWEARP